MARKIPRTPGGPSARSDGSDSCKPFRVGMAAYLDEQLDTAQREALEGHISRCFGCLGFLLRARRRREAFNRVVKDTLREGRAAPAKLRDDVKICLNCLTIPGSVRCPRLKAYLRLVPAPPKALQ